MIDFSMEQMFPEIQSRIKDKTPTSIVRYGDGEAVILNGFNDVNSLKSVLKRQLGEVPPINDIESIRHNLITAYKKADIIGIPVSNRFMDNKETYWYKAFGILNDAVGIDVLQQKQFTSIDFHSHFLDNGYWHKLLNGIDTLCYISCRDLDEAFKIRYNITNVYSFIIAPEMKFTTGYDGEKHYPDQFKKIFRWATKVPVEGSVCLVGAGFVGKIYNQWFKEHGGISIDAGCAFDSWAGKVTRGAGRGSDVYDDQYKL